MIKGYLFDYGGTLDTAGCHWGKLLWHAYQKLGVPVKEQDFRDAYVYAERKLGSEPIIQPDYTFYRTLNTKLQLELEYLWAKGLVDADEEQLKGWHAELLETLYNKVKENAKHSREVLDVLKEKGFPMVLVSNFYGNVEVVINEFGFGPYFQSIVESAQVGIRKPDPRLYMIGVERLGMNPEEVVVVGDSFYKDIEPAKKIGCKAYWFKGEGWTDQTYDETYPDRVITDLAEVL